ncbi:hypothetical protein IWX47DRAFT_563134 [Phyllosticta citricarpa]
MLPSPAPTCESPCKRFYAPRIEGRSLQPQALLRLQPWAFVMGVGTSSHIALSLVLHSYSILGTRAISRSHDVPRVESLTKSRACADGENCLVVARYMTLHHIIIIIIIIINESSRIS